MNFPAYPLVAILGAGPVGQALALMLARVVDDASRIVLVQGASPPRSPSASTTAPPRPGTSAQGDPDARVLALNHGSLVLLETLDARPPGAAPIHTIHVSQRGRLGRTVIRDTDFQVPQLGGVAPYPAVRDALAQAVARSGVTVVHAHGARVAGREGADVIVRAQDGQEIRCAVAVVSDGAATGQLRREYGQDAVLTAVRAARPRAGWAFERFTREGPLALLPHPAGNDCYAVVWCCAPARAAGLAALDAAAFSQALGAAFGDRLGPLACIAPRHVSSLFLSMRRTQVDGRVVAIGNAAQTLHPVAGQGLNLGLRDAAALAQSLAPWLRDPARDPAAALDAFAGARRGDRWLTTALTDLLPRVFTTGLAPVEHACGLALLALDLAAPLRAPLARHLLQGWRA
ncbi:FAD-dependent monooxygenase [Bordetella bronchialis]|uniref:Monooxygenase n=1 Tax=Bordetella bronchialis TaxID=463025 RepID=A0ABM6CPG3_9BORD|nr:FAD-dependent monooxygenase [Bordetella bronchialis]ANN65822.1 monooxygenase [Bordetella bronchialis]